MYQRLLRPPPSSQSFFLFGPRGTGKTLWVKSFYPNALYFDLLESSLYHDFLSRPQELEKRIPPAFSEWIVIDEIQRVPELLNEVHRLIEGKNYRFILTGSSARKLRQAGTNLLGGRARIEKMHPLTAVELASSFQLEKALQFGLMPVVWSKSDPPRLYLQGYVEAYLYQEVAQEGIVRQLGDFGRFLKMATLSQGQPLNMTNIAREAALPRDRVAGYFQIVEDLLIAVQIPPFMRRATRRLVMHPKFYFFDVGLYRVLRPLGPLDVPEEIEGVALETLALQNLRAINDGLRLEYDLFFWRTTTGSEVDFVLYGPRGLHAIEIKRARSLSRKDFSSLQAFKQEYPEANCWLVYGGEQRQYHHSFTAIPFEEFLRALPQLLASEKVCSLQPSKPFI